MKDATIAALEKVIEGLLNFLADPRHKPTDQAIVGLIELRQALPYEAEPEADDSGDAPEKHFGPD